MYKYLGIIEGKGMKHMAIKERIRKQWVKQIRAINKTVLNVRNKFESSNSLAINTVTYSFNAINLNLEKEQITDKKTSNYI